MNSYKEAIKKVLEFLDPDKELCPDPGSGTEALVRSAVVKELEEWRDWITEDDNDLAAHTDAAGIVGEWTSPDNGVNMIIDPNIITITFDPNLRHEFNVGLDEDTNSDRIVFAIHHTKENKE